MKKFHKIIGLSVALIVIHLSITGIILMYPSTFKLQDTYLSSSYILSLYDMKKTTDVKINKLYNNIGIISKKVIIDDNIIDTGLEFILCLAKENNYIFISSDKYLVIIKNDEYEPKIIKRIDLPFIMKGIYLNSNQEINFMNKKNAVFYLDERHNFIPIVNPYKPLEEVLLINADKESAEMYLNFIQGPGVHLLRFITDIHNGRFFGKVIMLLFTISGLAVIFLAISGTLMSMNINLKRQTYKKKKKKIARKKK